MLKSKESQRKFQKRMNNSFSLVLRGLFNDQSNFSGNCVEEKEKNQPNMIDDVVVVGRRRKKEDEKKYCDKMKLHVR